MLQQQLGQNSYNTLHFPKKIKKVQVDRFVPGCRIPSCQLHVKRTGQQPAELMHRIKLQGAKDPYNFFLIRLPAVQPPLSQGSIMYFSV